MTSSVGTDGPQVNYKGQLTKFFSSGWRREGHPHFAPQTPTTVIMFLASRTKWGYPATGPGPRQRRIFEKISPALADG